MANRRLWREEIRVDGDTLDLTLRGLIREGKARRIIVKDGRGRTLLKLPLWLGVLSLFNRGSLLALTAYSALTGHFTIIVERAEEEKNLGDN